MTKRFTKAGVGTVSGFGLNVFSQDDLDALHYGTLELLWDVGVKVESKEAVEIFESGGATVKWEQDYAIVKLPGYLVEESIQSAPSTVVLYGRDPKHDYVAEPGRVGFTTFGETVQIIDLETKKVRGATKTDLGNATLVCDYLDEIPIVEKAMGSTDKIAEAQALHNYQAMVTNTSKHCFMGFYSGENTKRIIEMAAACVGGRDKLRERPIVSTCVCPTSPLTLVKMCCDVIIECARGGIGMMIVPMSLSGATATATLAGQVVQHNAEVLSAIVLAQLTKKGTPCIYASCSTIMDLRFANSAVGAPEWGMLSAATAKLAQYYKLPFWGSGANSDSKLPDAQAGFESCITALTSALAGANIIFGAGSLESGLTFDFAKLLMDAENFNKIYQVVKGINVSDETMALDVIKEVGPGGQFMTHPHTFQHMRSMSQSKLFDRRNREGWLAASEGKDAAERAYEEAKHILATHKPMPLPEGATATMNAIIDEYETKLKAKKKNN